MFENKELTSSKLLIDESSERSSRNFLADVYQFAADHPQTVIALGVTAALAGAGLARSACRKLLSTECKAIIAAERGAVGESITSTINRGEQTAARVTEETSTRLATQPTDRALVSAVNTERRAAIPRFTEHGYLPKGEYYPTWDEFVARYGTTSERALLLSRLEPRLIALREAGVQEVTIGGSFITNKKAPRDIDAIFDRRAVNFRRLRELDPALASERPEWQNAAYPGVGFFSRDLPQSAVGPRGIEGAKYFLGRSRGPLNATTYGEGVHEIGLITFTNASLPKTAHTASLVQNFAKREADLAATLAADKLRVPVVQQECAKLLQSVPLEQEFLDWVAFRGSVRLHLPQGFQ